MDHHQLRQHFLEIGVSEAYRLGGASVLEFLTKPQLVSTLKERNAKGYSHLNKTQLIDFLAKVLERDKKKRQREFLEGEILSSEPPSKVQATDGSQVQQGKMENKKKHYTLKMTMKLHGVWRRMVIPANKSFESAFESLLSSFDFEFDHLYSAKFKGKTLYCMMGGFPDYIDEPVVDGREETLEQLNLHVGDEIPVEYDFGDNWKFSIYVESVQYLDNETTEEIGKSKKNPPKQYGTESDYDEDD